MYRRKAYNFPERIEDYLYDAAHYQELAASWHEFADSERYAGSYDDAETSQGVAAKYANIARHKMGLNPRDYDHGIS